MNGCTTRSKAGVRKKDSNPTLFEYPPNEKDSTKRIITFTRHDQRQLTPPNYINDTIISFFMQYHLDHHVPAELKHSIHIFNSFFFAKIKAIKIKQKTEDVSYKCASRWLRGVEIFNKDFLIMPICERDHWILVILCYISNPHNANADSIPDEELYEPSVIVLNSWYGHAPSIKKALSNFLKYQWHIERRNIRNFPIKYARPNGLRLLFPKVPQQKNDHNCGLYIINFFQCFLRNPRESYIRMFRDRDMTKWFEENRKHIFIARNQLKDIIRAQIAVWNDPKNKAKRAKANPVVTVESPNHNGSTQTDTIDDDSSDDSIIVIH